MDNDAILGTLIFSTAALCRTFGVTDPHDMDRIMVELMKNEPPGRPSEAIAQLTAAMKAVEYDHD
jgi:hypothetical protein